MATPLSRILHSGDSRRRFVEIEENEDLWSPDEVRKAPVHNVETNDA
jgi:hypothetical protein